MILLQKNSYFEALLRNGNLKVTLVLKIRYIFVFLSPLLLIRFKLF